MLIARTERGLAAMQSLGVHGVSADASGTVSCDEADIVVEKRCLFAGIDVVGWNFLVHARAHATTYLWS